MLSAPERSVLVREMGAADVVHVGWWNNPRICGLLRSDLPVDRRDEVLSGLAMDFQRGGFLQRAIAAFEEVLERNH